MNLSSIAGSQSRSGGIQEETRTSVFPASPCGPNTEKGTVTVTEGTNHLIKLGDLESAVSRCSKMAVPD